MAKTILVVEDEIDILKIIIFRLKKIGYNIITAEDGKEALDILKRSKPDLLILDLVMPLVDGYQVCKAAREDERLQGMPILLLTASATSNMIEKTKEVKANGYLIKPFETEELFDKVKELVGGP